MIPTNLGPMSAEGIIDHLNYSFYRFNRSEGCTAEALGKYFPETGDAMEAKYLAEKAINEARRA